MEIKFLNTKDLSRAMELSRQAGWNQTEEDWQMLWSINKKGYLGAFENGILVGTVGTINYPNAFGFINMVLVDKNYRGKGIGKILVTHAIELLENIKTIKLDATALGKPLYEQYGFRDEEKIVRMVCDQSIHKCPPVKANFLTSDDIENIKTMDEQVFGGDRSIVLQQLIAKNPNMSFLIKGSEQPVGFGIGRKGINYYHIGPLVAENQETAENLVLSIIQVHPNANWMIDVFTRHEKWIKWLTNLGFKEQRTFIRMALGINNSTARIDNQFSIAGPELA